METNFNLSFINNSNTDIYVNPANERELDEGFNISKLNLTWNATSFINNKMIISLNFSSPLDISPLMTRDRLIIYFN